jgi:HNH endonuclease
MISAQTRRTVRTIYAFACGYCGVTETEVGALLTIDHFQPSDAGGTDDIDNLVYACHACNLYKSVSWNAETPAVLHPLRTQMDVHIRLIPEEGVLQGLTPEGILHVETLHLNRVPLVERRKLRLLIQSLLEQEAKRHERTKQIDRSTRIKTRKIRSKKKS